MKLSARTILIILFLVAYEAAFYAVPLPDVSDDSGRPLSRIGLLVRVLLWPKELLLSNWFGDPPQFAFADRLPILIIAAVILVWAWVLGRLMLRLAETIGKTLGPQAASNVAAILPLSKLEVFVFASALGLNGISTWTLLMGLCGRLERLWTVFVPAAATFAGGFILWRRKRLFPAKQALAVPSAKNKSIADERRSSAESLSAGWLWLGVPFMAAMLFAGMLPPLDFDVREYHLQAPKEFFQQGRIVFLPHNVYANMPLGAEMLALSAMSLTNDWWLGALVGKTLIAAFTPLCALGLLAAGRRLYSLTAGTTAALLYVSVPWVVSISSGGLIEGATACYLFLAAYALLLWMGANGAAGGRPQGFLLLSGYLAGAAVATKYPALLFVLTPLAGWVLLHQLLTGNKQFQPPRQDEYPILKKFSTALRALAVFLVAAALGCGLWFGKNWVQTGNPCYPLLYHIFDGKTWNAAKDRQWNQVHLPQDFSPAAFSRNMLSVALTSPWHSPLIVPFLAIGLFCSAGLSRTARATVWRLLAYLAFGLAVWWLFTHRIDRFWMPLLPVAALAGGLGACWSNERWWRWTVRTLIILGLGANFLVASLGAANAWFVPLETLRHDPLWTDSWHDYLNEHVQEGRVLLVGDAAVFDLRPAVLYNTCFDDCIFEQLVKGKTMAEIQAAFIERQITFIYVHWGEIARYQATYGFSGFVQPEVFDRLVEAGLLEPLPPIQNHPGRLYRVLLPRK